jgi:hypothetical protein
MLTETVMLINFVALSHAVAMLPLVTWQHAMNVALSAFAGTRAELPLVAPETLE